VCREFDLANQTIQRFGKTEPKLLVHLNRRGGEDSDLEKLNEVTSMRRRLSGLSNREVTMYERSSSHDNVCPS
jgi:hypothetical protein